MGASTGPSPAEVERAKSQLRASLLLGLDGTTAIAEDIGRQLITTGKRATPQEIEAAINSVTPARFSAWRRSTSGTRTLPSPPRAALRVCWTTTVSVRTCRRSSTKHVVVAGS